MVKLKIKIIAKDGIAYEGEAEAIFVPTQTGIVELLPNHIQLVSVISHGYLIVKIKEGDKKFKVSSGVLEVRQNSNVTILVDSIIE